MFLKGAEYSSTKRKSIQEIKCSWIEWFKLHRMSMAPSIIILKDKYESINKMAFGREARQTV